MSNSKQQPAIDENLLPYLEICGDWAFALDQNLIINNCYKNSDVTDDAREPIDLIGTFFCDFVPENDQRRIKSLLDSCQFQESAKCVTGFVAQNSHFMELHAISLWKNEQPTGYKVLLRDINRRMVNGWIKTNFNEDKGGPETPVKQTQQQLLASISLHFSGDGDFDIIVNQALHMVGEYLDADRVVITEINYEAETISCRNEYHSIYTNSALALKQNLPFKPNNDFYRRLMSNPFFAVDNTVHMSDQAQADSSIMDEKSFIHFPIFVEGKLWGSFGIDFCRQAHQWKSNEINMLQTIVNTLASSIVKQKTEARLTETHVLLQNIIHNFPGIIWYCDSQYQCSLFDGKGMELLGFSQTSFVSKNMVELCKQHNEPQVAQMLADTFDEGSQRLNLEYKNRFLSMSTNLIHNNSGQAKGLVGICTDITDLRKTQQDLEKAIDEAVKANQAKSEFLSRMSHEIRTPMNAIIGMNTIARKSEDPVKIKYCLQKIQSASDRLLVLINDILDLSKIEANKFDLHEAEFDFEKMLQNVCNVIDVRVAEKKQNFIIDFNDVFTRNVIADELRLSQVLLNLLTNAVKFTPESGTVILKVRHILLEDDLSNFTIEVIDNGIGISQEQQKRLFSSFEQADGSITRRYGGTGLGLSICKAIVGLMGGEIAVESEPGKGSRFYFSINLAWGSEKNTKDILKTLPARDINILVIDDNEDVCEYFSNVLENFSLTCDTASNGLIGIQMVEEAAEKGADYQLIFIDWMMPGLNGIETARTIKKIVEEDVIVIMISVADYSEIQKEASAIGVDKFLSKPILPSVLFNSIIEWMNAAVVQDDMSGNPAISWYGKRMLLVEDIDINREIIISMLADTGIEIDSAENGMEAVAMFEQRPECYDVILMDLQMPEMDGLEATKVIRTSNLPNAEDIPIIAMTANAFKSDVDVCLAAGMNDHIPKPVSVDDLIGKIANVFDSGQYTNNIK